MLQRVEERKAHAVGMSKIRKIYDIEEDQVEDTKHLKNVTAELLVAQQAATAHDNVDVDVENEDTHGEKAIELAKDTQAALRKVWAAQRKLTLTPEQLDMQSNLGKSGNVSKGGVAFRYLDNDPRDGSISLKEWLAEITKAAAVLSTAAQVKKGAKTGAELTGKVVAKGAKATWSALGTGAGVMRHPIEAKDRYVQAQHAALTKKEATAQRAAEAVAQTEVVLEDVVDTKVDQPKKKTRFFSRKTSQ